MVEVARTTPEIAAVFLTLPVAVEVAAITVGKMALVTRSEPLVVLVARIAVVGVMSLTLPRRMTDPLTVEVAATLKPWKARSR